MNGGQTVTGSAKTKVFDLKIDRDRKPSRIIRRGTPVRIWNSYSDILQWLMRNRVLH